MEQQGYHVMIGKKRPGARSYTPDTLWEKAYEYFEYMKDRTWKRLDLIKAGDLQGEVIELPVPTPFTLETLCLFLGITVNAFYGYSTKEENEEYHDVCKQIKMIIDAQHFEGGMTNIYHAGLAARKLGLADRQDITSGNDKLAPPVIIFKHTGEPPLTPNPSPSND